MTSEKTAGNLLCYLIKLAKKKKKFLVRELQKKKIRFANSSSLTGAGVDLGLAVFCPW